MGPAASRASAITVISVSSKTRITPRAPRERSQQSLSNRGFPGEEKSARGTLIALKVQTQRPYAALRAIAAVSSAASSTALAKDPPMTPIV
jgi:hypothetical protein